MNLSKKIKSYLLKNHIDRGAPRPYNPAAAKFGVDTEVIRNAWRSLRKSGLVEKEGAKLFIQSTKTAEVLNDGFFKRKGDEATISKSTNSEVKNELDLAKECDIDLGKWEIKEWECKRYNAWIKNKKGEIESQPKYSVWAKMKLRTVDGDLFLQKEALLKELKAHSKKVGPITRGKSFYEYGTCLLELALFDMHLGKVANKGEAEENYDLKIAEERFRTAVKKLLERVNLKMVGKILFPLGNDLLHIDNIKATTFNETQMETDTRFHKLIKAAKRILIETIDELTKIAPVDVVVVVGNHDTTSTFLIGEILDAYYHNNQNVTVNNSPKLRKYYKFGKNSFQFSHGDQEKHADLGLIFATEEPKIWADTKYRFCQLGHFHKQKKVQYVSVDSFQGFQIQILPSLSSQDRWHYSKGYASLKQAKGFLFHPEDGQIGEYTVTM